MIGLVVELIHDCGQLLYAVVFYNTVTAIISCAALGYGGLRSVRVLRDSSTADHTPTSSGQSSPKATARRISPIREENDDNNEEDACCSSSVQSSPSASGYPSRRRLVMPNTSSSPSPTAGRVRRRDWVALAKQKIYTSLVVSDDRSRSTTPSDSSQEGLDGKGLSDEAASTIAPLRSASTSRTHFITSKTTMSSSDGAAALSVGPSGSHHVQAARRLRRRHSTGPLQFVQSAKNFIAGSTRRRYLRQSSELSRAALPKPPQEFFEPADGPGVPVDQRAETFYITNNLKMLELPASCRIEPRDIQVLQLRKGDYVVRPGDPDDSLIVPVEGTLAVFITHAGRKQYTVKRLEPGQPFFSMLSMLDILMDKESRLKTVGLRALGPCRVAKYSIRNWKDLYRQNPQDWTRPIQVVIMRLLHVTMTTLHQYFGLSSELVNARSPMEDRLRQISGHSIRLSGSTSAGVLQPRPRMVRLSSTDDSNEQLAVAHRWMADALGIADAEGQKLLKDIIRLEKFETNSILIEENTEEQHLWMLIAGQLTMGQDSDDAALSSGVSDESDLSDDEKRTDQDGGQDDVALGSGKWRCFIQPRELIGGLQLLSSEPSIYTVRASQPSTLAVIDRDDFMRLLEARPAIYLPLAYSVLVRLSPFLRGVDFALDWVLVESGQAIYRQADRADSLFVVLSGRLRSVVDRHTVVEEFGRGDILGMIDVLQRHSRSSTVLAVRYSQLARVPEALLNYVKLRFPQVGFRLVQLLGQHYFSTGTAGSSVPANSVSSIRARITGGPATSVEGGDETSNVCRPTAGLQGECSMPTTTITAAGVTASHDPMSHIKNLHTIAVLAHSSDVPLTAFSCELYHALKATQKVLRLSSAIIVEKLGPSALDRPADFRLMHWLNQQEDTYQMVVYECDPANTTWTKRCLRQADAILVVANGHLRHHHHHHNKDQARRTPKANLLEEHGLLGEDGVRTNKELVLLWRDSREPQNTVEWLKGSYYSGHHHLRAPARMYQWTTGKGEQGEDLMTQHADREKKIVEFYGAEVFPERVDVCSDFARLGRILTGNAIGLVLGGGGARGASHIGIIRAMQKLRIPIDIVGGTSIGSLIGGIMADTPDVETIEERAKGWFQYMCPIWRKVWDLTYAYSAMFTGAGFNDSIKMVFGQREIEDLWIPYFCISTDISTSEMRVHRSGPLWPYVRASMSLSGYLPPLCDPMDGHLLLDGGYVNNLPADVMRAMGARCVIAIDVASASETNLYNYGDSLSGFGVLLNRLNPWAETRNILGLDEIQNRLAFVTCCRQMDQIKKAPYCLYLRPPIEQFKTLDFPKFDTILDVGVKYGEQALPALLRSSAVLQAAMGDDQRLARRASRRDPAYRLAQPAEKSAVDAFADMAAQMSRIPFVRGQSTEPPQPGVAICEEDDYQPSSDDEPVVYGVSDVEVDYYYRVGSVSQRSAISRALP